MTLFNSIFLDQIRFVRVGKGQIEHREGRSVRLGVLMVI